MGANLSLIPELEELVQHGSPEKRVETLQRITALFLDGASRYNDAQVDLFDDVFGLHIDEIEIKARAELSNHLAPVSNAPVKVLRKLANDDDIAVAGPVLKLAPRLAECDLIDAATTKGQAQLHAISARRVLARWSPMCSCDEAIATLPAASSTIALPASRKRAFTVSSSAPRKTAFWPRR